MMPPLAILAGGLATRMRPLTNQMPKSMIHVHGHPFLSYQLKLARKNGINKIVMCVGFKGEQIEDYFGTGDKFNLKIQYSYDGKKLLGTGGAIKKALPFLGPSFFVMYGDSYLNANYQSIYDYFLESKFSGRSESIFGLMTVYKNNNQYDNSNIEFRKGLIKKYDKIVRGKNMQYIDWGLSILTDKAFGLMGNKNKFKLDEIFSKLIETKQIVGFEIKKRFYEIGSFKGLDEFKKIITNNNK